MGMQGTVGAIARQEWLNPVETGLQRTVRNAFRRGGLTDQQIKNALHGTWLGHPLHAALTDVPIGVWTASMIFDLPDATTDRREFRIAADGALMIGIAGALAAAIAGLTDWEDTDPPARRIGLTHGLLNVGGAALVASSLIARKRKSRSFGRGLAALGYAVVTVAARLGGNLSNESESTIPPARLFLMISFRSWRNPNSLTGPFGAPTAGEFRSFWRGAAIGFSRWRKPARIWAARFPKAGLKATA